MLGLLGWHSRSIWEVNDMGQCLWYHGFSGWTWDLHAIVVFTCFHQGNPPFSNFFFVEMPWAGDSFPTRRGTKKSGLFWKYGARFHPFIMMLFPKRSDKQQVQKKYDQTQLLAIIEQCSKPLLVDDFIRFYYPIYWGLSQSILGNPTSQPKKNHPIPWTPTLFSCLWVKHHLFSDTPLATIQWLNPYFRWLNPNSCRLNPPFLC